MMKRSIFFVLPLFAISCCASFQVNAQDNKPAEIVPAVFIVDDPPINAAYLMRKQMEDAGTLVQSNSFFEKTYLTRWKEMEKSAIIPNAFFKKVADWAVKEGVKGKVSLLACPGGLGYLDDQVKGYSGEQLSELIGIFKNDFMKNFDITPEVLTHTMGMDLETNKMVNLPEYKYMATLIKKVR